MNKNTAAIAFVAMLLLGWFMLVDRYPTVGDCLAGIDNYVDRGFFPDDIAADYERQCREADSRETRDEVVRTMDDDASIRASQR